MIAAITTASVSSAALVTLHAVLTFFVAAIGSLVTIVVAVLVRLALVPGEIEVNDRRARDRDEDLESWICDQHVWLRRELHEVRRGLAARAALESGDYAFEIGLAKEHALHEWRDQERQARRDVAAIYDHENPLHRGWRHTRGPERHELATPAKAEAILNAWRSPPASPGMRSRDETGAPVDDPTARTLSNAIEAARNVADYQ